MGTRVRSAKTGKYVNKSQAKRRPATTVTETDQTGPLHPQPSVLVKLASAIVHFEEWLSPGGHEFDLAAIKSILADLEIRTWLTRMKVLGLLPAKRS